MSLFRGCFNSNNPDSIESFDERFREAMKQDEFYCKYFKG